LKHIDDLNCQLDALCCNCQNANDANYLLHVLRELRQCASRVNEYSSSSNQFSTTMTLNSGTTITSSSSSNSAHNHQQMAEDNEIIELQNRLQFSSNVKPISLLGRNRHVIFSGVLLLQNETKTFVETWCLLLNDMMLFTLKNSFDNQLTVICEPLQLADIVDFRTNEERHDALIFIQQRPTLPYKIRYPNNTLQCAWQTIIDQRLKTWQKTILESSIESDDCDLS